MRLQLLAAVLPAVALALTPLPGRTATPLFTPDERAAVVAYWSQPGRLRVEPPPAAFVTGPWDVRQTTAGSQWLLAYRRAVGQARLAPLDPGAPQPVTQLWETWLDRRIAYDRWLALRAADELNGTFGFGPRAEEAPPHPGVIPDDLVAAVGNPPPLAAAVAPKRRTVTFHDGLSLAYNDNINLPPRFAHYRFAQGTASRGVALADMPPTELDALFEQAELSPTERRVVSAVSRLEGGFDSVNTYDTGVVSVGFIQFASLDDGKGSLARVLLRNKLRHPESFQNDFRALGIDVSLEHGLTVVDPETGVELTADAAARKVVDDVRLTAVFQRAGRISAPFRLAQVHVARVQYWPADDPITVRIGEQEVTGRVSDVFKSEAGLAALFDRKVNRGRLDPLNEVVQRIIDERGLTTLAQVSGHERELIRALRYRADFLNYAELSQPR